MWNSASTLSVLTTMFSETGVVLALVIGGVVTTFVALLGLGFALRKLMQYVYDTPVRRGVRDALDSRGW